MKTHRETGDPGCRAEILKHFSSTASFWKLGYFHYPLIRKQVLRGAYAVSKTFFKMGLRQCEDTFCFVRLVSYELRYSNRLS